MSTINRNQLRQAIIEWNETHTNSVPDFQTREKTAWVWKKVYATVNSENQVHFVELNFFQRLVRCLFYRDTILDKGTKDKVIELVHFISTDCEQQELLSLQVQKRTAETKHDLIFFQKVLNQRAEKTDREEATTQDLRELLDEVQEEIGLKNKDEYKGDYISGKFLDNILQLAKKGPQNEHIWKSIEETLKEKPDQTDINLALFKELIRVVTGKADEKSQFVDLIKLECQAIEAPVVCVNVMQKGLASIKSDYTTGDSWKCLLDNYGVAVGVNEKLTQLRDTIKSVLLKEEFWLCAKLKEKLLALGAYESLVDEYLGDQSRLANRLFFHLELAKEGSPFSVKSKETLEKIAIYEVAMRNKVEKEYESKWNSGAGDCFFLSCEGLQEREDWRKAISDEIFKNPRKYQSLVENRLQTDEMVRSIKDYKAYCDWISKERNWGGQPELVAFSNLTQRPVIVVQSKENNPFQWSAGINLDFKGDPFIFRLYGDTHFEAMVLKDKK